MPESWKKSIENKNGLVFCAYHKPFPLLDADFAVPVHAGRKCSEALKDGKMQDAARAWLEKNCIGDDSGDNISVRNNEYCECSVLYWIWKNVDIAKYKYIGLFQYRRQLILNDYFERAKEDIEKKAYKCVHFKGMKKDFCRTVGLSEERILELLEDYDCIVPYASDLGAIDISSPYEDWVRKIQGLHVNDLIDLEELMRRKHPALGEAFTDYLNAPYKLMYQIFIAKPRIVEAYCSWLFDILTDMDQIIDTSLYSVNGKRTLGYLAEILYGFYFTRMKETGRVKECGVSFIEGEGKV